ncbi:PucR family transcriptional regulator [Saccharopolyspora shandongensis]|uniref:PucR family transcriptional regulator n=1 Tax=Saccharopolyspora shandongensis TaxID=418495 RepID=UPI0033EC7349
MNARPGASLARILEDLGSTVLDVAVCPDQPPSEVTTVAVHDPDEHLKPPAGALVLGVGVADPGDLLLQLGRHAASALVVRAAENAGKWRRSELVRRVLTGGSGAELAARRMELAEVPLCVVAAEPSDRHEDGAERELAAERLCELLSLHLAVRQSKVATASALGTAYAILPLTTADPDAESRNALGLLQGFATRRDAGAVVGMGRVAWSPGEVPRSRADADAVLDVLRSGDRRTARVDEVWERLFLARLRDLAVGDEELRDGPVQALTSYDADHHSQLVATLSAYLDAFGDVARTAQAMHVHPNTLRYRLRRITEVSGLDLSNPDVRLAVGLQLRVQGG